MNYSVQFNRNSSDTFSKCLQFYNTALNLSMKNGIYKILDSTNQIKEEIQLSTTTISSGIQALGAQFNYGMNLLVSKIEAQARLNENILETLDKIHQAIITPDMTRAREYLRKGNDLLRKGLIDKALESYLKSIEIDDTNFLPYLQVGKLYIYGIDENCDLIDLQKAEEYLKLAARYIKAEISVDQTLFVICAECYFHASIACYVQGVEAYKAGEKEQEKKYYFNAIKYAENSIKYNSNLYEAFYHLSKYYCLAGNNEKAIEYIEQVIINDKIYLDKALSDSDLEPIIDILKNNATNLLKKNRLKIEFNKKQQLENEKLQMKEAIYNHPQRKFMIEWTIGCKNMTFNDAEIYVNKILQVYDPKDEDSASYILITVGTKLEEKRLKEYKRPQKYVIE